jgi:hypothetical protein
MLSIAAEDVPVTRDEQTVPALSSDESRQVGHNSVADASA